MHRGNYSSPSITEEETFDKVRAEQPNDEEAGHEH